jgi:hypothetical protein
MIQKKLVTREHGYLDYDIEGCPPVHRVCIPLNIKQGDIFNVYCDDCVKVGRPWKGSVEASLTNFTLA